MVGMRNMAASTPPKGKTYLVKKKRRGFHSALMMGPKFSKIKEN